MEALSATLPRERRDAFGILQADLEDGSPFPLDGRQFTAVIVVNYLFRPLFPDLIKCLAPDGLFLYDTFAIGQEALGKPANPDFLLRPGELLKATAGHLNVIAFEQGQADGGAMHGIG